jgi:hypothetical protein
LDSREQQAGQADTLQRDLAAQQLLGQREDRAAGIAASNNDFMMNRGEARSINSSNWDRWGQLTGNGTGGVSRFTAIGSGVKKPRVNTGFGFVSR